MVAKVMEDQSRKAGLKESEKTELILAPTWLVRSSGVCNAPRFNFGRTGTQFLSRITGGSRVGMTVMVDQTRSGLIPCAAYCKSANTVFPQFIQCNVHNKMDFVLNGRSGEALGTEKLTRGFGDSTCTPSAPVHIPIHLRVYMWTSSERSSSPRSKTNTMQGLMLVYSYRMSSLQCEPVHSCSVIGRQSNQSEDIWAGHIIARSSMNASFC